MKRFLASKVNLFVVSLTVSLFIQLGFSLYQNFTIERPIAVIDFGLMSAEEVLAWASSQQLRVEFEEVYDEEVREGQVISQSSLVGERLFAGSKLVITLSKGPDPEVLVNLINFENKDIGDVQLFIESNKLLNAEIVFEKSDRVSSAFFLRQEPTSTQIKRGDAIRFYISTGDKDQLTTVRVPDFSEYTRQQISTWASSSNIKVNFIDEFNANVLAGKVISQSQDPNTDIYDGSSLTVRLSLGEGVVLDNFVGKTKTTIDQFINSSNLKVTYTFSFSANQNKDFGISMNPSANTRVAEGSTIEVVLSLGRISLSNFTGKRLNELEAWVAELNKQGANLKVTSASAYSDTIASGLLISQTPSSGDVNPGSEIRVSVSKGAGVTVRNFVGSTTYTQENLRVSRSDTYHPSVPAGQVISQSIAANTQVDQNANVSIVVSLGRVNISNYTGNSLSALQAWVNGENAKGANLSISSSTVFNAATSGNIVSQNPSSGSVNPGTSISVSVSKGPGVTVANFVGYKLLEQQGLNVSTSFVFSDSIPSGQVISQSIAEGKVVDIGTSISLTVSKGARLSVGAYDFTNLNSFSSELIESEINSKCAGMSAEVRGTITCRIDRSTVREGAAGKVYAQEPRAGTDVFAGDSITIFIAK